MSIVSSFLSSSHINNKLLQSNEAKQCKKQPIKCDMDTLKQVSPPLFKHNQQLHEMPETKQDYTEAYNAMRSKYLPKYKKDNQHAYNSVIRTKLRSSIEAFFLVIDPKGSIGLSMLKYVRKYGWIEFLKNYKKDDYNGISAQWLQASLDRLLYKGSLKNNDYLTGSILLALWRDSQEPKKNTDNGSNGDGRLDFIPGYINWEESKTYNYSTIMGTNAEKLKDNPERFFYEVAVYNDKHPIPSFALYQFLPKQSNIFKLRCYENNEHFFIPVLSTTLLTKVANFNFNGSYNPSRNTYPLQTQARLGTDSFDFLNRKLKESKRLIGISHPLPGNNLKTVKADGYFTGEGGFSLHDIHHYLMIANISHEARLLSLECGYEIQNLITNKLKIEQMFCSTTQPQVKPLLQAIGQNFFDFGSYLIISQLHEPSVQVGYFILNYLCNSFNFLLDTTDTFNTEQIEKIFYSKLEKNTIYARADGPQLSWAGFRMENVVWLDTFEICWHETTSSLVQSILDWAKGKHFTFEQLFPEHTWQGIKYEDDLYKKELKEKLQSYFSISGNSFELPFRQTLPFAFGLLDKTNVSSAGSNVFNNGGICRYRFRYDEQKEQYIPITSYKSFIIAPPQTITGYNPLFTDFSNILNKKLIYGKANEIESQSNAILISQDLNEKQKFLILKRVLQKNYREKALQKNYKDDVNTFVEKILNSGLFIFTEEQKAELFQVKNLDKVTRYMKEFTTLYKSSRKGLREFEDTFVNTILKSGLFTQNQKFELLIIDNMQEKIDQILKKNPSYQQVFDLVLDSIIEDIFELEKLIIIFVQIINLISEIFMKEIVEQIVDQISPEKMRDEIKECEKIFLGPQYSNEREVLDKITKIFNCC